MARYVLRVEPLASADHDTLAAWIAPTLQCYLTGEPPAGPRRRATGARRPPTLALGPARRPERTTGRRAPRR